MAVKIGDFVQCPVGLGCPPKFGYIQSEGTVSKFKIPVWIIQTAPGKREAFPKDATLIKFPQYEAHPTFWRVYEGNILRANQSTKAEAEHYMKPGRTLVPPSTV